MNINEKKPPKVADCVTFIVEHNFKNIFFKENELWNICEITTNKITLKKIVNYTLWNYMLGRVVKHYSLVLKPTKLISDGGIWAIILSHSNQSGPWTL